MKVSTKGLELIKRHEGLRLEAYRDVAGVWTIGYGHTRNAVPGMIITRSEAEVFLKQDLAQAEDDVATYVLGKGVSLVQNQFDALVSLVFNLGSGNIFTKNYNNGYPHGSTLYNRLLAGDYSGAADRFGDFIKAGGRVWNGLVKRRADEKALFEKKNSDNLMDLIIGAIVGTVIMEILTKAAKVA